jgi:hypothetical protein
MLERDKTGKIVIDFSKEESQQIPIKVLDERYTYDDFKYAVNVNFKSLPNAMSAENYIMVKYNNIVRGLASGIINTGDFTGELVNLTSAEQFFSNIANLININSDNIIAQKEKVRQLEQSVDDTLLESREKSNLIIDQSNEILEKDRLLAEKDRQIELLKESITSLLNDTNIE